jgi:hypothetical protein
MYMFFWPQGEHTTVKILIIMYANINFSTLVIMASIQQLGYHRIGYVGSASDRASQSDASASC